MIHSDENDNKYYETLDEAKQDGLMPIKVSTVLMFFTLNGRKTKLSAGNLSPIENLKYCVHAKADNRYYIKEYRDYSVEDMFLFKNDDISMQTLRRYVDDRTAYLLLTPEQVAGTVEMLKRLYKDRFKTEGQLSYKYYLAILDIALKLEDYLDYGRALTGFKTAVKIMEENMDKLWLDAKEIQK